MHKIKLGLGPLIVFGTVAVFSLFGFATAKDKLDKAVKSEKLNSIDAASTQKINNEELENQIEAFLMAKIKDAKLFVAKPKGDIEIGKLGAQVNSDNEKLDKANSNKMSFTKLNTEKLSSEIVLDTESEIVGLKCYSIRQFLVNEGVKVAKIYTSNIAEYIGQLNNHFSSQLQEILSKDLKNQISMAKTTHRPPRICFVDIKDATDGRTMIFVSPNILLTPKTEAFKAVDFGFNEEQLVKEKQKEQGTKTGAEDSL